MADHEVDLVLGGRPPQGPGRPGMVAHAVRPNPLIVVCSAAAVKTVLRLPLQSTAPSGDTPDPDGPGSPRLPDSSPPDYAAGEAPELLPWLARQTWLLREHGSGTRATTESFLDELELTPRTLTVGSNVAVCESVAAGLGVTLISRDAVARELGRGALVELPTPATPLRRDWRLVSREGQLPAPTRLFVQHVLRTGKFHRPAQENVAGNGRVARVS